MRISTLCLALMIGIGLSALEASDIYGQSTETTFINIEAKHVPLTTIFSLIEEKTDFLFVFPPELVGQYADVSVEKGRKSVRHVLLQVLQGTLQYREAGENLVIFDVPEKTSGRVEKSNQMSMIPIRGKITNTNGEPVPGASVFIKGTTRGTTTDADGQYTLNAAVTDWLIFSFIGYKQVEVQVGERTQVDLVMEEDLTTLQTVEVSTGYYEMSDRLKTANITKITSKEISGQPITNPLLALQGRVAGLELSPVNGAPGSAPLVKIRGNNSLRPAGGYPLYVIDGVMIDSSPIQSQSDLYFDGFDPLAGINPENIESVEILKDADATSIYGSKGANGVIIIKTKIRRDNISTDIEVSSYYGMGEIPRFVNLLNTSQYLEMRKEAFKNAGMTPSVFDFDITSWDSAKYTNWQKKLLGGASKVSDIEIAFSGGNDQTSFRLSGGYHKETTFVSDNFGFDRRTVALRINHRSTDNRFIISATANYGITNNKILNLPSFIQSALTLPPNAPSLYQEDGSLEWGLIYFPEYNFTISSFSNPMAELLKTNESNIGTLVANSSLSYRLARGLNVKAGLGYTDVNGNELIKSPILASSPALVDAGSTATALFGTNNRRSFMVEPQVTYDFDASGHAFNVLVGSTFQQNVSQWQAVRASGYTSDVLLNSLRGATSYVYQADKRVEYRYAAAFARIGYNWHDKYLINLTGRRDGSSRFGPGKQFGNFGAIGAAWIFSSEDFMKSISNIVSLGKVRGSYGTTGNDQIDDYKFYNLYTIGDYRYQNLTTLIPKGLFNKDFKWEVTKKLEVALELSFLSDRLSVQASWYRNRSSNQIIDYQLPATTGFSSISKNFGATVENKGWEFSVQSRNINSDNFTWTTSINMTVPRNVLVSFPDIEYSPYSSLFKVGAPLSIQNLYVWKGVDPQTGSHVIADLDDNGSFDDKDKVFGSSLGPKYYGGIMNTLRFGGFEMSFLFQFSKQLGRNQYNSYPGLARANQPDEVMNRWRQEGDITSIAKFSNDFSLLNFFGVNVMNSNYNVVDASFIRLKTLSMSYIFSAGILDRLKIRQARIFFQGQNLFVISKFAGLDPETGAMTMPQLRIVTGGVNLKF